jgi:hypothetical protein
MTQGEFQGYGYEPEEREESGGIREYEPIKIMLLERTYHPTHVKAIEEENQQKAEEATLLGLEFVPKKPSYKEGGVSWLYAVVQRTGAGDVCNEKVLLPNDDGTLEPPNYKYSGLINQLPPQLQYEKKWDMGVGGNLAGKLYKNTNYPFIQRFLPPVWPPYDFRNKRKYDDIPLDDHSEEVLDLRGREKKRNEEWKKVIDFYNALTEEQALHVLEMSLAYRFTLGKREGEIFNYVKPAPGMTFTTRRGAVKSQYLDIDTFFYDKDTKLYNFFVNNVVEPDETSEYIASMIATTIHSKKKAKKTSTPDPNF